jgi:hypothetical protein
MELTFRQMTKKAREMMDDHRWAIMEAAHAVIDRPNSSMTHSSPFYDHEAPLHDNEAPMSHKPRTNQFECDTNRERQVLPVVVALHRA